MITTSGSKLSELTVSEKYRVKVDASMSRSKDSSSGRIESSVKFRTITGPASFTRLLFMSSTVVLVIEMKVSVLLVASVIIFFISLRSILVRLIVKNGSSR